MRVLVLVAFFVAVQTSMDSDAPEKSTDVKNCPAPPSANKEQQEESSREGEEEMKQLKWSQDEEERRDGRSHAELIASGEKVTNRTAPHCAALRMPGEKFVACAHVCIRVGFTVGHEINRDYNMTHATSNITF